MTEEITEKTIIKMGTDARLETLRFSKDTITTLLKKYRHIRDTSEFLEESVSKTLQNEIEESIKAIASKEADIKLFEIMGEIFRKKD